MWLFLGVTVVELLILYFVFRYMVKGLHRLNKRIDERKAAEAAAEASSQAVPGDTRDQPSA